MIIAECCGNWHDLKEAKAMIPIAKASGAGLVKFQLYDAEDDKGKPIYDFAKAHELTFDQAKELYQYGEKCGIEVFFSVFGVKYVEWCERMGVRHIKVAADVRDPILLTAVINSKIPIIISEHSPETYIGQTLWCPSGYPATIKDMPYFNDDINDFYDGFSDHTIGLDAAKIALARGAQIIEKHFILEHNPTFPDSAWSMLPSELAELARFEKVCKEVL